MKYLSRYRRHSVLMLLIRLQRCRYQESGFSLVATVAVLVILSALLVAAALVSKVDTASTNASAKGNKGFAAAEAGLNLRAKEVRNQFEGFNRPSGTSPSNWQACADGSSGNDGTEDFGCSAFTFQSQDIFTYVEEDPANPGSITIPQGEAFAGLLAQEYTYDVISVARETEDLPTAILGMTFKSRLVPLFQFAVFYDKDLEISPGPNMTLSGPVHSNGDLYLNGGHTLTIEGQITVANGPKDGAGNAVEHSLFRGRKDTNNCGGAVNVFDPQNPLGLDCGAGRTLITDVSAWNNQIQLGLNYLELPPVEFLDPDPGNPEAVYWQKADLRIVLEVDANGNPSDQNGNNTYLEVRDVNSNRDNAATTALLTQCNVTNTTVAPENGSGDHHEANDTVLFVNSTNGFNVGDVISVNDDYDSNVISSINSSNNTLTIRRRLGHSSYQEPPAATNNQIAETGDPLRRAVISTSDTFWNYREGKAIRMLEVDVRGLLTCLGADGNTANQNLMDGNKALDDDTEGGLVWHFTVDGPNSDLDVTDGDPDGNNYGVRLRNGAELDSNNGSAPNVQGLTIVSDQAIYILGNYNSVDKKPAAFLSDSLNILSNSWDIDDRDGSAYDSNNLPTGRTNMEDRTTSDTTINAAFLSGTDTTGDQEGTGGQGGAYNGGLENYPRFHENWSGRTLLYRGSFVSLGNARRVDGAWCGTGGSLDSGCNIYRAPDRDWNFDIDFRFAENLPPLSPRFVYLRQELFQRDFDQSASLFKVNLASAFAPNVLGFLSPALSLRSQFLF